jgi:hypothetical protein
LHFYNWFGHEQESNISLHLFLILPETQEVHLVNSMKEILWLKRLIMVVLQRILSWALCQRTRAVEIQVFHLYTPVWPPITLGFFRPLANSQLLTVFSWSLAYCCSYHAFTKINLNRPVSCWLHGVLMKSKIAKQNTFTIISSN